VARTFPLFVGGLLGPLGGGVVATMLPEMAHDLDTGLGTAGASLTSYFAVFAVTQLVSGTLGERWGRRRTVRIAYLVYAAASVLCAIAPTAWLLLSGRVLQGAANAFTTPLLLAGLTQLVAPDRLSRTVGVFGSLQAAGQSLAPLFGGLADLVSWRLAFVAVAVVAGLLALAPPPGAPRRGAAAPRWADLFTGRMTRISLGGMATYLSAAGLPFLVALLAERTLGVSDTVSGLVLATFGVAGLLLAPYWGTVCERFGPHRTGAVGLLLGAVLVALVPATGHLWLLTLCWAAAGACSSLATVSIQNLAVREIPGNRGGAVSAVSAFRFAGGALAPVLWLPLYPVGSTATTVFLLAAVTGVIGATLLASLGFRTKGVAARAGGNR
jgi:MFS family permease